MNFRSSNLNELIQINHEKKKVYCSCGLASSPARRQGPARVSGPSGLSARGHKIGEASSWWLAVVADQIRPRPAVRGCGMAARAASACWELILRSWGGWGLTSEAVHGST
jgi:hypothetical protein